MSARIDEGTRARIIRSEGHPNPIAFAHLGLDIEVAALDPGQVLESRLHVVAHVLESLNLGNVDVGFTRRHRLDLHQSDRTPTVLCDGIEARLLIGHRRNQTPIETKTRRMLLEEIVVVGKGLRAALREAIGQPALGLKVFQEGDIALEAALLVTLEKEIYLLREPSGRELRRPGQFTLAAQRHTLDDSQLGPNSIERLAIRVTSRDLDRGLDISVTGDVNFHGAKEPGRIQLDATLTGLTTDGVPTPNRTRLVMTAKIHGLHTALVDTVADLGGLLVAAVGPRADLEATVDNFSSNSGTLTATLTATNGRLEGRVTGGDNGMTVAGAPIRAELEITPPLRDRLLRKVHPLFADIRTTDQPLRVELASAFIPLDGDVSRLQAQFDITVGRVELDSGSAMLAALTIFNAVKGRPGQDSGTISGYIEPIKARIVDGVMSYDAFVVRIDKFTLVYAGTVDLNTQTLDLRTHVPLAALVSSFTGALKGLPPETAVPLITRGPIDNPTTTVDPSFVGDAVGKAAEDLLKKELENAAKKHLGGLFGGGG